MQLLHQFFQRLIPAASAIALVVSPLPAQAAEQTVNLASNGRYVSRRSHRQSRR